MKFFSSILLIVVTVSFLGGCLSTSGPIVFDEFKANGNDSFAKTTMRLGGSNKFVDSKAGEGVTREVAGKNVNRAMQVLSLNFLGFLQDSITTSVIEDEPLAENPYYIIEVDNVSEQDILNEKELENITMKAELKLIALAESAGFKLSDRRMIQKGRFAHYPVINNDEICKSFTDASSVKCGILIFSRNVASYNKTARKAYVGLGVFSMPITTFISSKYSGSDVSLFIPKRIVIYGRNVNKYQIAENAMVIHAGKAHRFVRGATLEDGINLNTLKFIYGIKDKQNNDKETLYTVNPYDLSFTETR